MVSKQCNKHMLEAYAQSKAPSMCTYVTYGTNEELLTLVSLSHLRCRAQGGSTR